MKKSKLLFLLSLSLLFTTAAFAETNKSSSPTHKPLDDFELGKYQYCGTHSDCVMAVNGCCDCVNGGIEVAINKERMEAFEARFDCRSVACPKLNNASCNQGTVSCLNHKCKYIR